MWQLGMQKVAIHIVCIYIKKCKCVKHQTSDVFSKAIKDLRGRIREVNPAIREEMGLPSSFTLMMRREKDKTQNGKRGRNENSPFSIRSNKFQFHAHLKILTGHHQSPHHAMLATLWPWPRRFITSFFPCPQQFSSAFVPYILYFA